MKAVLISIHPKWCELIAEGKKTIEIRKTRPKLETPFKCYIYCTKDNAGLIPSRYWWKADKTGFRHIMNGKVIGEFVCNKVDRIAHCGTCNNDISLRIVDKNHNVKNLEYTYFSKSQLSYYDIDEYSKGCDVYGWHISNLVIYDKPRELGEFHRPIMPTGLRYENDTLTRPPQSWCYVESEVNP